MTDNIETEPTAYTYDESIAIATIRKSMRTKPEIITRIMEGAGYEIADRVLKQMRVELEQLLAVARAFTEAARVLAEHQQESEKEQA